MDQTTDKTAGQETQLCKSEIQKQKTLKCTLPPPQASQSRFRDRVGEWGENRRY